MWNALVVLFYLPVALGCLLYLMSINGEYTVWSRTVGEAPVRDVVLGVLAALPVVVLTQVLTPRIGLLARMAATLRTAIGELSWPTVLLIAAASAVGEELLFRAVIQAQLGIVIATVLFAAVHVPYHRSLWLWPVFALASGGLLGGLYTWTGAALAPAVCHFVVNAANLAWLTPRPSP